MRSTPEPLLRRPTIRESIGFRSVFKTVISVLLLSKFDDNRDEIRNRGKVTTDKT